MKLGPVNKLDKRHETTLAFDNDVMSANYDVIVIVIYGKFEVILKPDSGRIACKTYIFTKSNLLSYKC